MIPGTVGSASLQIGQRVGNYEIVRFIGAGGMGAVYLAEHPGMGRLVAIKVVLPRPFGQEQAFARFINEARAASAISHAGIVEVYDFGTLPSGLSYLVMEYLEGESLRARIARDAPLAIERAIAITAETATILGAAHAKGIIHRDLKPDNMHFVADGVDGERLKLLDFGTAKLLYDGQDGFRTETGVIVGTPNYMSPEQCRGVRDVDHRTDVYALGVILFELVCGRRPFLSQGTGDAIQHHLVTPPPLPRTFNPKIPVSLQGLILSALEKDPRLRLPSMAAFREALATLQGRRPLASDSVTTAAAPARERRPRPTPKTTRGRRAVTETTWGLIAAGVAVLAAAAIAARVTAHRARPEVETARQADTAPAATPPSTRLPAPTSVTVQITSEPAGARVVRVRDGADVGTTPLRASWPAGEGVEKVTLELPGYTAPSLAVARDRDVTVSLKLERLPGARPAPHAQASSIPPARAPAFPVSDDSDGLAAPAFGVPHHPRAAPERPSAPDLMPLKPQKL